ncbi:plasmid-related protein [Shewanella zhangzhouensis]|uniref:plasmid-related protein n=1 Tax=Shewanella zhangzhouensis TaxID=2864213 RepID=UPI001C6551C8|nr:plasmid-related protein [Shewanella zhangzhouensis]QYK05822.1 plasmid-related protein [Shewanella zhangzhouensis]
MHLIKVISSQNVERLKQLARKLKREQSIPHHQALEIVAINAGFNHWKEVTESHSRYLPTETAFLSGVVLAFDLKEASELSVIDSALIRDHLLEVFTENSLRLYHRNLEDEDDNEGRTLGETLSDVELDDDFRHFACFEHYRLNPEISLNTVEEVLELARKYSFWPPEFIWIRGKLIDTGSLPATDEMGNTVAIRW